VSLITFAADMLICAIRIDAAVDVELVVYRKQCAFFFESRVVELFSDPLTLIFRLKDDSRCFLYQCSIDQFTFSVISFVRVIDSFYHTNLVKVKVKGS